MLETNAIEFIVENWVHGTHGNRKELVSASWLDITKNKQWNKKHFLLQTADRIYFAY